MTRFRTYHEVEHDTGSQLLEQVLEQRVRMNDRLAKVRAVVAVASGKGGVGKSAVTANLAATLASRGYRVGVVDADLNGPSIARMLGASGSSLGDTPEGVAPAVGVEGIRVISMELLQEADDTPLRWREPSGHASIWQSSVEVSALREFLADVLWGELDFLLVDVPPGTDKITRLLELVPTLPGMLVVTTPGEGARTVVARSLRLVQDAGIPVIGLVANMAGYLCPDCGTRHELFPGDAPAELSRRFDVPIWAEIPFAPAVGQATERGRPWVLDAPGGEVTDAFDALATRLATQLFPEGEP